MCVSRQRVRTRAYCELRETEMEFQTAFLTTSVLEVKQADEHGGEESKEEEGQHAQEIEERKPKMHA